MTSKIARKAHHHTHTPFPGVALTVEQVYWLRNVVAQYIAMHQDYLGRLPTSADADHSSLLYRLLSGKPATKYPPPLDMSYPWYSIAEAEESGEPFSCDIWEDIRVVPLGDRSTDYDDYWNDYDMSDTGERLLTHTRLRGIYKIEEATIYAIGYRGGEVVRVPYPGYRLTRVELPPEASE